ncbi:MAG TPA: ankyrin repeat domain-containing protein [Thermoanaerobaculia bacterium]
MPPSRPYLCRRELERANIYSASRFVDAARHNWLREVRLFVQTKMPPNVSSEGGETPLIAAARAKWLPIVELLLAQLEIDINVSDQNGDTALIAAARGRGVEVARALLAHPKIEIDLRNKEDETAWVAAIRSRCHEIDGDLKKRRADPHRTEMWRMRLDLEDRGIFTEQAFVDCCQSPNKLHEVRIFLAAGMGVNASGAAGNTGLIVASEGGHEEVVKFLLAQPKIDVNARNTAEDTALIVASRVGREKIVHHLVGHKDINVNARNRAQESALLEAACRDFAPIVAELQIHGAIEPDLPSKVAHWKITNSPHPFSEAEFLRLVHHGGTDWVKLFLLAGVSVEARDKSLNTALILAAEVGNRPMMGILLEHGAAVDPRNLQGDTALIVAARLGRQPAVELLLAQPKIDANARNAAGETALLEAMKREHGGIITALQNAGARDPDLDRKIARWKIENSPHAFSEAEFLRLVRQGRKDWVALFLLAGISIEARDESLNTALILAAEVGDRPLMEILLEHGAAVNARNFQGDTALIVAARLGRQPAVELLLAQPKIDANARNAAGETALLEAMKREHGGIVTALQNAGARDPDLDRKIARWKIEDSPHAFSEAEFLRLVRQGRKDWVALFLLAGISVEARDESLNTALILAAEVGDRQMVEILLEHEVAVNARNLQGDTALIVAARLGRQPAVALLLGQKGLDVNARNAAGETALLEAAKGEHAGILTDLENAGARDPDLDRKVARWQLERDGLWSEEPFVRAAGRGQLELVEKYLLAGMDPNARDGRGNTGLILAARNDHVGIVRVLLAQKKIEVNARSDDETSALMAASGRQHQAVVDLLLAARADRKDLERALRWRLEERGHRFHRETFVDMAGKGQDALVELYLDAGMAVDAADDDGNTALIVAAGRGDKTVVRLLLQRGADVGLRNRFGSTALEAAVRTGHEQVAELLRQHGAVAPEASAIGLLSAVEAGDGEGVRRALADGAAPDQRNEAGEAALTMAVRLDRADIVTLLLSRGADTEARDAHGKTPLMAAAELGRLGLAATLLGRGAAIDAATPDGSTALMLASWRGQAKMVELLTEHGADVNRLDSSARTPLTAARAQGHGEVESVLEQRGAREGASRASLLAAAERGDLEGVRKLLNDEGARTARDEGGNTPLMLAARRGYIKTFEALLSREIDLEQINADGDTALMLAAAAGRTKVVEALLDRRAHMDSCNSQGRTALLQAASAGKGGVVTLLAKRGANPALAASGTTPLVEICRYGPASAVQALIDAGADVNQQAGFGSSPLMAASLAGQVGIVELLRRERAWVGWEEATLFRCVRMGDEKNLQALDLEKVNLEARDERGRTALLEAAEKGQAAMVGALLAAGASSEVRALNGDTALKLAAASGSRPALAMLVEHTERDEAADTAALLAAAERGHAAAVGLLVEKTDARINGIGTGRVPLVVAAARGHFQVVATLLELKADIDKRAANGQTALTAARLHGHQQIVAFLEGHGAQATAGDVDLLVAASDGDLTAVRRLLAPPRSVNLDARDGVGRTALMRACEKDHVHVVEALLAHAETDLEKQAAIAATDLRGRTPLIWAAIGGERQIVSMLLGQHRETVGARSVDGRTALLEACHHGWPEIVEEFLAAMANEDSRRSAVDAKDNAGNTPLAEAFLMAYPEREQDYLRIVDVLERHGATLGGDEAEFLDAARRCDLAKLQALLRALVDRVEIDGPRRRGKTALMLAVETGCVVGAQLLLHADAGIDLPGPFGATPLILATRAGQLDSLRLLLESHAEIDARDSRGETALFAAVKKGIERAAEILIAAGANVDVPDREGRTPLMRAVLDQRPVLVHRLLEAKASNDKEDSRGRTALTLAHLGGRRSGVAEADLDAAWERVLGLTPIERHLLAAGARHGWNEAELLLAARDGEAGEVRRLLGEDVEVQAPDLEGNTTLLWACRRSDLAMAQALLAADANPDVRNNKGRTPLLESVEHGSSALVQALLRPGLSLDDRDEEGDSALLKAAKKGFSGLVVLLAKAGAAVNLGDRKRQTPLLVAVRNCDLEAIRCLLDRGANACGRSTNHRTAIMEAAARGDDEVLKTLLSYVKSRLRYSERLAYLNAVARVDDAASTALDLAERGGHTTCAELLRQEGGKPVRLTGYTVFLTQHGDFYHRYTCGACAWGRQHRTLVEIPIDSPRLKHYPPCDKCNPNSSYQEAKFDWMC